MSGLLHIKSVLQINDVNQATKDVGTQCGKWLQFKRALDKNEVLRAKVLEDVENIISVVGYPKPNELSPEDERQRAESRDALSTFHIADLALVVQPLNTCKWDV